MIGEILHYDVSHTFTTYYLQYHTPRSSPSRATVKVTDFPPVNLGGPTVDSLAPSMHLTFPIVILFLPSQRESHCDN